MQHQARLPSPSLPITSANGAANMAHVFCSANCCCTHTPTLEQPSKLPTAYNLLLSSGCSPTNCCRPKQQGATFSQAMFPLGCVNSAPQTQNRWPVRFSGQHCMYCSLCQLMLRSSALHTQHTADPRQCANSAPQTTEQMPVDFPRQRCM